MGKGWKRNNKKSKALELVRPSSKCKVYCLLSEYDRYSAGLL